MGIKEDFLDYTGNKWGASKFTDKFSLLFKTLDKTNGLWTLLWEMRQKTYNAIAALVDGKVDKSQTSSSGEVNKIPIADGNGYVFTKGTKYSSYNEYLIYGKNYLNTGSGGQIVSLPPALENKEIEIYRKKINTNTNYLLLSGSDKILDLQGNDITSSFNNASIKNLDKYKYIKIVGMKQPNDTGGLISEVVSWVLVDFQTVNFIENFLNNSIISNYIFTIKKSSTEALKIKNDSDIICFNVDTIANSTTINREQMITTYSFDGGGIIPSFSNKPQYGELFIYDGAEYSKFARYSFYKKDNLTSPEFQLIQNYGISITNKNNGGTVVVSGAEAPRFTAKIFTVYN